MADIFISYSRKDSAQALDLAERLLGRGLEVWIDRHGIVGAEQWATEIVEGIKGCTTFVLLLSGDSVKSDNVLKELSFASESHKRILPVEIYPIELPVSFIYPLVGLQRVKIADVDGIVRAHKYGIERIARRDTRTSLIVMPFEDLSPSQDNKWFADGLAGELIDSLAHIKALRILDRKTSYDLRGVKQTTVEIGKLFNTRYFIEGSVQKFGEQIKISVSLLDVEAGEYLWQESHKGEITDIFDVQESVATKVVEGLKLHLTREESAEVKKKPTENVEAYELFLKGQEYFVRYTKTDFEHALGLYEAAVQIDPSFALAYTRIATTLSELYRTFSPNPEFLERAEKAAEMIRISEGETAQYFQTKSKLMLRRGDVEGALDLAKKSVECDPNYDLGHSTLGFVYAALGRMPEAAEARGNFVRLRENDRNGHYNLLITLDVLGNLESLRKAAEQALPIFERHIRLNPDDYNAKVQLAQVLQYAFREQEALRLADGLCNIEILDGIALFNLACVYLDYKNVHQALPLLRRAVKKGYNNLELFQNSHILEPLREMPEFQTLIKELEEANG